jgi:DNA-binding MarR family transcriptional regulator
MVGVEEEWESSNKSTFGKFPLSSQLLHDTFTAMGTGSPRTSRTAVDLRVAVGRIARRIRQIYATGDPASDAGFIEISVLARLDRRGPLTSKALAEIEQVTPQAIGSALSALEQRGYVSRASDPGDGRKVISTITEAGRRTLLSREQTINEQITRAVNDRFNADERRQLAAVIPLLERLGDEL